MKTAIIAAIVAASVSAPAFAQDRAPFTGPHADVVAGWESLDTNGLGKPGGFLYGLNLGYDVQAGPVIVGIEGEVDGSTTGRTVVDSTTNAQQSINAGRDFYVGGRIGVPVYNKVLVYAKGGYTNARLSYSGLVDGHRDADGYRLGGGVEYSILPKVYLKTEYRYSNYDRGVESQQVVGGVGVRF